MADGPDVSAILRRTVQANASFYKGWVDLSLDYWRRVGEIFGVDVPSGLQAAALETVAAAEDAAGGGMLVLEGDAGTTARGAFLVTNDLGRNVKCELVTSGVNGPDGAQMSARVTFEPANIELAPGEQHVVHALIPVDDRFAPGAAYTGEVAIRGMDGYSVPFVLRRTHSIDEAEAAARQPAGPNPAAGEKTAGAKTAGKANKASAGKSPAKKKGRTQAATPGKRRARQKE